MVRFISIALLLLLTSCAQQVSSIKEDKDILNPQSDTGYLLIGVDLAYELKQLDIKGPHAFRLSQGDLQEGADYFLVNMPAGNYSFTYVSVDNPISFTMRRGNKTKVETVSNIKRYNLTKGYWDFTVEPNVISYIGHLRLKPYGLSVNAELENRSSQALTFMENKFPIILNSRNVRYHGPGQDFFFERIANPVAKLVAK